MSHSAKQRKWIKATPICPNSAVLQWWQFLYIKNYCSPLSQGEVQPSLCRPRDPCCGTPRRPSAVLALTQWRGQLPAACMRTCSHQTSPKSILNQPCSFSQHSMTLTWKRGSCQGVPTEDAASNFFNNSGFRALWSTSARGSWHKTFWWGSSKEEAALGTHCPWISIACQQSWNVVRFGIKPEK